MITLYLNYNIIKKNKLTTGKVVSLFSTSKEMNEFLASPEAKMWSDYYHGGTYSTKYGIIQLA